MLRLRYLVLSFLTAVSSAAIAGCSIEPGKINFGSSSDPIRYNSDRSLDTPMATGATSTITVDLPAGSIIASASTGDTSVASLGAIAYSGTRASASFPITAKTAGSTPFVVLDENGKEIGRATVHVADTKIVQVDTPAEATLVADVYTVHATTIGDDGVVLVGDGAIQFEPSGALAPSNASGGFCTGDCGTFEAKGIGDGYLHIVAKGASADRTFHVIDRASIDKVVFKVTDVKATLNADGNVTYTLFAGATPVIADLLASSCTTANPAVATVDYSLYGNAITADPEGSISVAGHASGTTTVTCTVGSSSATATVTVP